MQTLHEMKKADEPRRKQEEMKGFRLVMNPKRHHSK